MGTVVPSGITVNFSKLVPGPARQLVLSFSFSEAVLVLVSMDKGVGVMPWEVSSAWTVCAAAVISGEPAVPLDPGRLQAAKTIPERITIMMANNFIP